MIGTIKNPIKIYFKDFGYRVIRLKYFTMVVGALLLEITTLVIYLLNNENILSLDLFSASILYGTTSTIVVVLAVGVLVLMKLDKSRDIKKVNQLINFKKIYSMISNKYWHETTRFTMAFENETEDLEEKINYAITLKGRFEDLLNEFSGIKVANFLKDVYKYEYEHLLKEKIFYKKFSSYCEPSELRKISTESESAHRNYLTEIDRLEKNLSIII